MQIPYFYLQLRRISLSFQNIKNVERLKGVSCQVLFAGWVAERYDKKKPYIFLFSHIYLSYQPKFIGSCYVLVCRGGVCFKNIPNRYYTLSEDNNKFANGLFQIPTLLLGIYGYIFTCILLIHWKTC